MPPFARRPEFDPNRDFVCQTFFRAGGHVWERNADFDKALVDGRTLKLLYDAHKIGFKDTSAADQEADLAPVTIEDAGDGSFSVNAPWLESPETAPTRDSAFVLAQKIRAGGEPNEHHGVAMMPVGGGWYSVNAAWLSEPEKIQGQEAAYKRAAELRESGPSKEQADASTLIGSDHFAASYDFGGETLTLAQIVAAAQAASGHDAVVWNAMDEATRDSLIKAEIERRQASAGAAGAAEAGSGGAA